MNNLLESIGVLRLFQVLAILLLCIGMFGIQYDQNDKVRRYIQNAIEREGSYSNELDLKIEEVIDDNPNTIKSYSIYEESSTSDSITFKVELNATLRLFILDTFFTYSINDYVTIEK